MTLAVPEMPVIVNNTPMVAFYLFQRFDLFRDLFDEVFIPQAVYSEFLAVDQAKRATALAHAPWIKVIALQDSSKKATFTNLDEGEAEVLAVAQERNARLVIVDEERARKLARRLELPLSGTLGILILAKENGLIDAIRPFIKILQNAGFHFSETLLANVFVAVNE